MSRCIISVFPFVHLIICNFNLETAHAVCWSDLAQPCDIDLWVMKWRSVWPIFHSPVIDFQCILISCIYIILWDYESVWSEVWPQSNVGHYNLYFIVKWFGLISWMVFDVWTSLVWIMSQYDPEFDLKVNVGHFDLISWSSNFALHLKDN